jgi:hypothetical protein
MDFVRKMDLILWHIVQLRRIGEGDVDKNTRGNPESSGSK